MDGVDPDDPAANEDEVDRSSGNNRVQSVQAPSFPIGPPPGSDLTIGQARLPPGAYSIPAPAHRAADAVRSRVNRIDDSDSEIVLEGFLPTDQRLTETREQRLRREVQEMRDNAVLLDDSAVRALPMENDGSATPAHALDIEVSSENGDNSQGGDDEKKSFVKSPLAIVIITILLLTSIALAAAFGEGISNDGGIKFPEEPCFKYVLDRYDTAKTIILSVTSQDDLDLCASPQSKALEWIVCQDEISSKLMDAKDPATGALPKQTHGYRYGGDSGEAQVLRRYTLATFLFSTSERPWNQTLNFLSPKAHECSWHQNMTGEEFGYENFNPAGYVCKLSDDALGDKAPVVLDDAAGEIGLVDFTIRVDNNLTGTIPSEFGSLAEITSIGLQQNKGVYGTLPSTMGNLTNLGSISIQFFGPNFGGVIPKSLFSIPALEYLTVTWNEGVWSFPPTIDPNGGSKLLVLAMSNTGLSSTLPPYISGFKNLTQLDLAGNSLEGIIPEFIGKLSSLKYFSVYDNNLNGTLPSSLGQLTNLTGMVLGKNSFGGLIPSWIGNLSKLRLLDLGHNKLEGEIPTSFSGMSSLELVSLQNNSNLNGSIAPFEYLDKLASLLLYSNNFGSSIPSAIFSNYNATGKRIFADFGHNRFTGTLPAAFSQWASNISYLSTMKNNFDANAVPDEVCDNVTNIYADCSSCQCCNGDCCKEDSTRGRYSFCDFDLDFSHVAALGCGHWWFACHDNRYA